MYKFQTLAMVILEEIVLIKHDLVTGHNVALTLEHYSFVEDLDRNIDDLIVESAQAEWLAGENDNRDTAHWLAAQYREVKAALRAERSVWAEEEEMF
jgi:hypothetical protein